MKTKNHIQLLLILGVIIALQSCTMLAYHEKSPEYVTDLVCGLKVDKTDAYTWKYKGEKYYFDNYNCKESFKTNPENFINKKCITPDNTKAQK